MSRFKLVTEVAQDEVFFYVGRRYVLATEDEAERHPALGVGQVMAYYLPDRGGRVPVSFASTTRVIGQKK